MGDSLPAAPVSTAVVTPQRTYTILRPLGEGGMGRVLLVQDPDRPEPVALKLLQASLISETRVAGFKREFALLAELHHPHVCRVYDFGYATSHHQHFFTAEYVAGEELYRAMRQAPLEEIERVILQLLSALDCIHGAGLIHFDIKGANILVSRRRGLPHATLVDFGVTSPMHQPLTEIGGTLRYMAPEILWPNPPIDPRIDCYSFGVVCYRMLTGCYPNEVHTLEEARAWHARERPDFGALRRKGVPDYLAQFTQRLLATNPNDRFSSAAVALSFLALHLGRTELLQAKTGQLPEGPMIGREGALTTLTNAIERVAERRRGAATQGTEEHPQAYYVAGARGFGKSRLLKELKYTAQLKECATWLIDAEREGTELCRLLAEPVTAPTCYLVDNLDRAAPEVQRVVGEIVGLLYAGTLAHRAPPLVLIASFTPDAGAIPRGMGTPILELDALSQGEVRAYLAQVVGGRNDFEAFAEAIWNFSQGVPLLMTEAARRYIEEPGKIPRTIEELYRDQVRKLAPESRRLLELIAFCDRPMAEEELAVLADPAGLHTLNRLTAAGLVRRRREDDRLIAATGALTQTLMAEVSAEHRRAMADRVVDWLAQASDFRPATAAAYAPDLSDPQRAAKILEDAANEAEARGESEKSAALLTALLSRLSECDPMGATTLTVQRRIATARLYQGKYHLCEEMLHQIAARRGAPAIEDLKLLGLVKRAQRRPAEARVFYEQALAALPPDPSNPQYLYFLNERAQTFLEEGVAQQAAELYTQSQAMARQLPAAKRHLVPNNNLGMALARLGKFDEAVRFYREKLRQFGGQKRLASSIYGQLGAVYLQAGTSAEALEAFEQAWQLSVESGDQHSALPLLENLINVLQKQGAYSAALRHAERSLQMRAAGAPEIDVARSLLTVANLYLNLGLHDLTARYLIQAMRLARRHGNYELLGWTHITFGYLHKELGRWMEALNEFEETIAIGESRQDTPLIRWGCYGAVDVLVDNGEVEEAMPYWQQLTTHMHGEVDREFRTRHAVLMHKLDILREPHPGDAIGTALQTLAAECVTHGWRDLEWEVAYLSGVYHHKRDEAEAALAHFGRAQELITAMADHLGEEYRESFLAVRSRARVQADFESLTRAHRQPGVASGGATATSITGESIVKKK